MNVINVLRQYNLLDYIKHGMPSWTFDRTHSRTTSGVDAFLDLRLHTQTDDVVHSMQSWPLESTHGPIKSGTS